MHTSSMDFDIPTPTLLEISIKLHYIYLNFVVLEISSFPWDFQAGLGGGVTAYSEGGHHHQIAG